MLEAFQLPPRLLLLALAIRQGLWPPADSHPSCSKAAVRSSLPCQLVMCMLEPSRTCLPSIMAGDAWTLHRTLQALVRAGLSHSCWGEAQGAAQGSSVWGAASAGRSIVDGQGCTDKCEGWALSAGALPPAPGSPGGGAATTKLLGRLRPALMGRPAWRSRCSKPSWACTLMARHDRGGCCAASYMKSARRATQRTCGGRRRQHLAPWVRHRLPRPRQGAARRRLSTWQAARGLRDAEGERGASFSPRLRPARRAA